MNFDLKNVFWLSRVKVQLAENKSERKLAQFIKKFFLNTEKL